MSYYSSSVWHIFYTTNNRGGGVTVFIPSLGRERMTVAERLTAAASAVADPAEATTEVAEESV